MANKKTGFDYFNIDTYRYLDLKIKRLKKVHGATGIAVYDYILSNIYRENGYFIDWSEHFCFDISDYFDLTEDLVNGIVRSCLEIELFSDYHFNKFSILTSKGIQARYNEMSKSCRRSGFEIAEEYEVTPHNVVKNAQNDVKTSQNAEELVDSSAFLRIPPHNADIPPHSSYILPQSKVKESKEEESKEEEVKQFGLSPDPHSQNAEESKFNSEIPPIIQPEQKKQTGPGRKKQAAGPVSLEDWGDRTRFEAEVPEDWPPEKRDHYWAALENYSNKGNLYKNWAATAKAWARNDAAKGNITPWKQQIPGPTGRPQTESPTQTDDITRIIDEFNALTSSQYDTTDEAIRGYLAGRLMDGCKPQDMMDVIALKAVQWGSGDERKFLKFQTLFKSQNYPGYLQEVRDAKAGKIKVINPNESNYDRIQRKIDAALGRTQSA